MFCTGTISHKCFQKKKRLYESGWGTQGHQKADCALLIVSALLSTAETLNPPMLESKALSAIPVASSYSSCSYCGTAMTQLSVCQQQQMTLK